MARLSGRCGLISGVVLLCSSLARASFPEPDFIIWGNLGDKAASSISATWPAGQTVAQPLPGNLYILRVPVDNKDFVIPNTGRGEAAHLEEIVRLRVDQANTAQFTIRFRGQLEQHHFGPPTGGGLQKPGDCNQDGNLNISDASCVLGFLFLGRPTDLPCGDHTTDDPANMKLLDFNADGKLDLSDGVGSLTFLFLGGGPHFLGIGCVSIPGCPSAPCVQPAGDGGGGGGDQGEAKKRDDGKVPGMAGGKGGARANPAKPEQDPNQLASILEVTPQPLRFGSVRVGERALKTISLRNHSAQKIVLGAVKINSQELRPLHDRLVIPAAGQILLGVLFIPDLPGRKESVLELAPGLRIPIEAEAVDIAPSAVLGDVLISPRDWNQGHWFEVPVALAGLPPGATVEFELSYPGGFLRVQAPAVEKAPESAEAVTAHEGSTGLKAAEAVHRGTLVMDETGACYATILVGPPDSAHPVPPGAFSLAWRHLGLRSSEPQAAASPGFDSGLRGTFGEVVVGESPLDLDRDNRISGATDLVYAARWLHELAPLPRDWETERTLSVDDSISHGMETAAANWPQLDGSDHPFSDWQLLRRKLLGLSLERQLPALRAARLNLLSRGYSTAQSDVVAEDSLPALVRATLGQLSSPAGDSSLSLNVKTVRPLSGVVLDIEVSPPGAQLRIWPAGQHAELRPLLGVVGERPGLWRVVFQDELAEHSIPAGDSLLARLGCRSNGAQPLAGAATVRLVGLTAWHGRRQIRSPADTRSCSVLAQPADGDEPGEFRTGDCNADGAADLRDIVFLARVVLGHEQWPRSLASCDADGDGRLGMQDVLEQLRQYAAGR